MSHASQIVVHESIPGFACPHSFSLSIFSSVMCEGQRVPVLITDEEWGARTPGLTSRHSSLWDHFSVDGTARLYCPSTNRVLACLVCMCAFVCVVAYHLTPKVVRW